MPTPIGLLRRGARLVYRTVLMNGRAMRALVMASPDCIARCCDGTACNEVIRLVPCRSHTGPPDNPCSVLIAPFWVCADSYCRHSPIETRETFADFARRGVAVTVLVGNVCFRTDPASLQLRADMTDAERQLLDMRRDWQCVGDCNDPVCVDGYDPCACLCYAVLTTDGQDSYFCCYGPVRQTESDPPPWSTQFEHVVTVRITVEHLAPFVYGSCDLGRTPVTDYLMERITRRGVSDARWAGHGCNVRGTVTDRTERFCLPGDINFFGCGCVPDEGRETVTDTTFFPGHGYVDDFSEPAPADDGSCQSYVTRMRRQTANSCLVWAWHAEVRQVSCTSARLPDGTIGPIARITVTERTEYRQTWTLTPAPYAVQCAPCEAAVMGARSTLVTAPAPGVQTRPVDPAVAAIIARQLGGCRGCGE